MFRYINKVVSTIILLTLIASSEAWAMPQKALPKLIQANYIITKDGQKIAKVREQYTVTGDSYQVESVTKGIGIYALMGERKLTSTGKVTKQGLQPTRFELHQGYSDKKTLLADFDWKKSTLTMNVKGENHEAKLSEGTQDLASFAYQFMFLPKPPNERTTVTLTTGKKLNVYKYQNNEPLGTMSVAGKVYKTVHLVPANQSSSQVETRELWLAENQHYLLVRFVLVDDKGEKLVQTLTDLVVE
ncbi:MAG: DUF3108 domain-containing protein [Methylophilaceae bacterium]